MKVPDEIHTELRDGTPILLRPIRPDDRRRLAEGLKRLSPRSRYLRFHTLTDELSSSQLDYFTQVDQHDHVAWIAVDEDHPEVPGVGVARCVRIGDEPEVAEAAVTVADEYQGKGAGTLLLGVLAARAREEGIRVFRNYVLAENEEMLEVFEHLGGNKELEAEGLYRVDLPLPEEDEELPHSAAGRAFLAVARNHLRLDRTDPPVWMFWRRSGRRRPERSAEPAGRTAAPDDADEEPFAELDPEIEAWLQDREHRT